MKIHNQLPQVRRPLPGRVQTQDVKGGPQPPHDEEPSILKAALLGAGYGALVGAGTALLYSSQPLTTATGYHMAGIAAGGIGGAAVLGRAMQPKVEAPASYALGALAGAGVTWGTSAFGLLHQPVVGAVAGAALGALYGGIGALVMHKPGGGGQ